MKLRYLLSALAGVAILASCVEVDPVASYDLAVKLSQSAISFAAAGGSHVVDVTADVNWSATLDEDATWLSVSPLSGQAGQTVKVTVTAEANMDNDRTGVVTIKAGSDECLLTVIQLGDPHGTLADDPLTCAEARALCLSLADQETSAKKYYIKGIVSSVVEEYGTQYGNGTWWMSDNGTDQTFEVYRALYIDNVKYDDTSKPNIHVGDVVTVYGIIMNYKGTAETSSGNAYLYKLESNTDPVIDTKTPEIVIGASETSAKFEISGRNLTEGWKVTTDAAWVTDYTKSGEGDGTVEVTVEANTNPEAREATFTVTSAGAADLVLTLKQGGYTASGTLDKPYTVAEAIAAIKDNSAAGNVYVKGIISKAVYTYSASYNTGTFWISDDGVFNDDLEKDFEAYKVYWVGGSLEAPVAAADIKANYAVGDEVILYGALTAYTKDGKTTYETSQNKAKIHSINWAISDENGVGNVDYPFNNAGAHAFIDDTQEALAAAKEAGETITLPGVAVKGKVSKIIYSFDAEHQTGTFWLSDDGTFNDDKALDFEAYSVYWLENKAWEEGFGQVEVGDEVIVKGQLTIYKGTYETSGKNAYLYSLNGVTEISE